MVIIKIPVVLVLDPSVCIHKWWLTFFKETNLSETVYSKEIGTIYFIELFHVLGNLDQFERYKIFKTLCQSLHFGKKMIVFQTNDRKHHSHIFANAFTNWFCSLKLEIFGNFRQHWKMCRSLHEIKVKEFCRQGSW